MLRHYTFYMFMYIINLAAKCVLFVHVSFYIECRIIYCFFSKWLAHLPDLCCFIVLCGAHSDRLAAFAYTEVEYASSAIRQ